MKQKLLYAFVFALTLGLMAACSKRQDAPQATQPAAQQTASAQTASTQNGSGSVAIAHELGMTVVPLHPAKVAVFDMGTLDIINVIGANAQIAVPGDIVTSYLSQYKNDIRIGGIKESDMEGLYNWKPDIIFISGRQRAYYPELSRIAPTVYMQTDPENYLRDMEKHVTELGKIFGREDLAREKLAALTAKVDKAKAAAAGTREKALIILTNDGSMSAYGKGSRFGMIHDIFGIPAADDTIKPSLHGQEISYEYIARVDPEILYVVDRTAVIGGTKYANATLDNPLVASTRAAKNGKIVNMDAEAWYLTAGGLTATDRMIDDILAGLGK